MDAEERRLLEALLRASDPGDWTLARVLEYARRGLGVSITVLVNGVWIEGDLVPVQEWADALDDGLDQGLKNFAERLGAEQGAITDPSMLRPGTVTAGDLEWLRDRFREGSFRSFVDEAQRCEADLRGRAEALPEGEEVPDELADELATLDDALPAFTLSNAVIEGSVPMRDRQVPLIRVLRSHVAAWHLGRRAQSS